MHKTILHERSPIQQPASPTCILFHFLNIWFTVCMHDHFLLLTLSIACIDNHIFFQLSVGMFRQPWPGLYLNMTLLCNPEKKDSIFLSENSHFFLVVVLQACIVQFWGTITARSENCTMQSLILQPLPAEIAHYTILAASRPVWIAH